MSEHQSQNEQAEITPQSTLGQSTLSGQTAATSAVTNNAKGARGGRLRKLWKKNWRGLLIFILVLAVAHASLNIYASVLLNRELAQIRQKGEPLSLAQMVPPQVPESQNAAPLYKQATNALQLSQGESRLIDNARKVGFAEENAVAAVLRKNQRALQLTRQAAARPECRFPIDWNASPVQILLPHYAEVRQLARLLTAQAVQSAQTGNMDAALRDVQAMFRISDHVSREPILIGFLVSRAIHAQASQTLARILEISPIPTSQSRAFLSSLPKTDWSAAYRRTMMAERTFTLWAYNTVRSDPAQAHQVFVNGDSPNPLQIISPLGFLWRPFLKMDEVYALRLWQRNIAAISPMQVPAPKDEGLNFDAEISSAPSYAIITRLMFPAFSRAREQRDSLEVERREMEVALALSAYRVANGSYPPRLVQVEPAWGKPVPVDPYSNKPFVYRSEGRNFTLYSVGPNRVDEGGLGPSRRSVPLAGAKIGDDIVWNPKSDD